MRHTRDALWFLLIFAVGLAMTAVALVSFPVALACGIREDVSEAWKRRRHR